MYYLRLATLLQLFLGKHKHFISIELAFLLFLFCNN